MKTLISIAAGLVFFILVYLIGAFVQVSFDISKWSADARVMVGAFGGTLSLCIMFATGLYKYMNL